MGKVWKCQLCGETFATDGHHLAIVETERSWHRCKVESLMPAVAKHQDVLTVHGMSILIGITNPQDTRAENESWLIYSRAHNAWWGPNGSGYRIEMDDAGRFTFDDAYQRIRFASRGRGEGEGPPEFMVRDPGPQRYIDNELRFPKPPSEP